MITVNMHEAKTRLSELVRSVEESGEPVILCRDGKPVAQIQVAELHRRSRLAADPSLKVAFAPGFDPVAPLDEDDVPAEYR